MSTRSIRPTVAAVAQFRALGVFAVLGAIGWWGHHSHWTIGSHSPDEAREPAARAEVVAAATPRAERESSTRALPSIKFESSADAKNCGIECGPAQSRSVQQFVTANGTVDYDQTRIAQLSVRTPGVVWRVEKKAQLLESVRAKFAVDYPQQSSHPPTTTP